MGNSFLVPADPDDRGLFAAHASHQSRTNELDTQHA
jgi:hypothetical protein